MPITYFIAANDAPVPVDLVTTDVLDDYISAQSEYSGEILKSEGFGAKAGELVRLPDMTGHLSRIVFGMGDGSAPLGLAALSSGLKGGVYRFDFVADRFVPATALCGLG